MTKKLATILFVALVTLSLASFGCKGRAEKAQEAANAEGSAVTGVEEMTGAASTEPAQTVAMEPIPPTAAPMIQEKPIALPPEKIARDVDIQRALKNAGFYSGAIDGKIGPRTKRAIEEFQRAKGLKVDGKVGPKTWAELEKCLLQQ